MVDKVLTTISRYSMLASRDRVAVAVSGGPDSVCLFHVLMEIAPRVGFTVSAVAHLNHKLRGEASEEDQRFVAAMAARHGVAFFCDSVNVIAEGGNLEQAARRARHAFFTGLVREGVADRLATGHTSSDQAETVLFRLLRGSGLKGLAGILQVTESGLIRPLLEVTRTEVEDFLRSRGVAWREDASNRDPRFARNRIRHHLLPQLERDWNPRIAGNLGRLADLAREEEQYWQGEISRLAGELFTRVEAGLEVDASRLSALPKAVARRLIRHAIGRPVEFDHVERILALAAQAEGGGKVEIPGLVIVRSFDILRFTRPIRVAPPAPILATVPGRYKWPGGPSQVCFELSDGASGCVSLKLCDGRVPAPLELRGWRVGDHYRPAGHFREQTVKELFQEGRVPSWQRQTWPIVSIGSKIVWSRKFGPAADAAADEPGPALRIWEEDSTENSDGI